ncbi:MAG: hypothetical protein AB8G86_12315 [Saprospiraceae bacterium]
MNRFYILFLFYCLSALPTKAQHTLSFPYTWQGQWKGDLEIYTAEGLSQSVPMELHILPTDSTNRFTWTIIYGADKEAGKRPYELVILDAAKGLYAIDEKNSIQLEGYYIKDKFFSRFEVMGSLLLTTEQLVDEELIFEIIVGSMSPVSITGNEVINGDTIPPVQAFPIKVMQRAILRR